MRPGLIANARSEVLGEGTGIGTTITAGNTVYGSLATIGTTTFNWDSMTVFVHSATRRQRLTITANNGGSDATIVEDLPLCVVGNPALGIAVHLPVFVPSGAAVKAKSLGSAAGGSPIMLINGFAHGYGGYPGRSRIRAATDWTNADPSNSVALGGTAGSYTAWTTIQATTLCRIGRLWCFPTTTATATTTAGVVIFEIGVGSAGNEKSLGKIQAPCSTVDFFCGHHVIPCDIPAGSRLSFRATSSTTSTDTVAMACVGLES